MVRSEQSSRHAGQVNGDACGLDGLRDPGRRRRIQHGLAADDEDRATCVCNHPCGDVDAPGFGVWYGWRGLCSRFVVGRRELPPEMPFEVCTQRACPQRATRRRRLGVPAAYHRFVVQQVDRALDEYRARHAVPGCVERSCDRRHEVANATHSLCVLDERSHQAHLVDILQGALVLQHGRRGTAQDDDRGLGEFRVLDRRDGIRQPGSRGHRRDAGYPREARGRIGGEYGRGFVSHVDYADAEGPRAAQDRRDVATAEREQLPYTLRMQVPRNAVAAVHFVPPLIGLEDNRRRPAAVQNHE